MLARVLLLAARGLELVLDKLEAQTTREIEENEARRERIAAARQLMSERQLAAAKAAGKEPHGR